MKLEYCWNCKYFIRLIALGQGARCGHQLNALNIDGINKYPTVDKINACDLKIYIRPDGFSV